MNPRLLLLTLAMPAALAAVARPWTGSASASMEPVSPTPAATMTFFESSAAVTPDPSFAVPEYRARWPHISLAEAKRLHGQKGVVFVDGRNHGEWQHSHIPGALSLPVGDFDFRYRQAAFKLKRAKVIVAYCHGENCRLADTLAQQLVGKGHKNVAVFTAGFPGWSNSGLPLQNEKGKPLPTPTFKTSPQP